MNGKIKDNSKNLESPRRTPGLRTPRKKILRWVFLLSLFLLLLYSVVVFANGGGPVIDRWVLSGGGGRISGNDVTLDGTLGQPVTGISSSGQVWLGAGYWYAEQPVEIFLPLILR